jgi:transposase InsO family protein/transposase-like protein
METRKRREYTSAERRAVLADVRRIGVAEAAKTHGVPKSCVSRWASAAGVKRDVGEKSAKAATPRSTTTSTRSTKAKAIEPTVKSVPPAPAAESALAAPAEKRGLRARIAKVYTPSQKAEVIEYASVHGVTAASTKFDISRFSIYDWRNKVAKAAKGQGPSPTSGPAPKEIEATRDREILAEWHKHPGLGPSQIRNQLRRGGIKVAVHTVRRVMEDAGYRPPKVKREPHDQRYEAIRPNHLWHLDFVQRHINRASTFTLILIDDYSRFVVGHGVDEGAERADLVLKTFEEAVARHGRPERVMDDKGAAFWSWRGISRFTDLLTEMGIDQVVAEKKEWNGKIEVFNGNLHKELFDVHRFYDVADMRRRLAAHLHWYNHARTHHALGGLLVPADRFYGRVEEVLARIEAGAARDAKDLLDLRDRCLELFKVTSRGGVPEIWLLGQKLLGGDSPL